ncbi:ABC-type transport auxiliary lipoprotein family protein [Candidatus Nitrosacidococcus sp. I8]|uniref:ABC-type transport auxiliary lipoprotein family protein n=1 Tax=Candidatus Nitrosacidococcus sp. I8 TaxID=2942908 RepID=UPI0022267DF6|nr:ABC-type transport auxiliary lipoprotein family protein [Candidatus Nitrosacidococcus sp. I8]CAH9019351.1 hypothetical protein NURINAE_01490 [Candidatus Nitrosacidococcus sp. I8]
MAFRLLFIGILIGTLSGCSNSSRAPSHTYLFSTPQHPVKVEASRATNLSLIVTTPRTATGYNTQRMAYTRQPYELSYFSYNDWVDTPGYMLEPVIISTLADSDGFLNVTSNTYNQTPADLRLDSDILALLQDYSVKPSQARFSLHVQLVDLKTGKKIASDIFNGQEPIAKEDAYNGVTALNKALEYVLGKLVDFIIENGQEYDQY